MKKNIFLFFALFPIISFASDGSVETDIVPRTVNFLIFVAIMYYLLSDKIKAFFQDRTNTIQGKLDEVQKTLQESKKKIEDAKNELQEAKQLANDLLKEARADVDTIKKDIAKSCEDDMAYLSKNFDEKIELEARKSTKEVVDEVLGVLLSKENIAIGQKDLTNIILKKVA